MMEKGLFPQFLLKLEYCCFLNLELNYKIAIIGQGYVGLPLAISFSKFYDTIGYDKSLDRIDELNRELIQKKETPINEMILI